APARRPSPCIRSTTRVTPLRLLRFLSPRLGERLGEGVSNVRIPLTQPLHQAGERSPKTEPVMAEWPRQSPVDIALRGVCPRCGHGRLFRGLLTVVDRCVECGLDLRGNDAGDGPAVFVILGLGAIVMMLEIGRASCRER